MPELTKLTKPHKEVIRQLQLRGLEVSREAIFDPYTVDIYLPRYHAAVEVDGPTHVVEDDEERDKVLWELYYLYTFRIPTDNAGKPELWWQELAIKLNSLLPSTGHRLAYCDQMMEGV